MEYRRRKHLETPEGSFWGTRLVRSTSSVLVAMVAVGVIVQSAEGALRAWLLPDLSGIPGVAVSVLWLPTLLGLLLWRVILRPLRAEAQAQMTSLSERAAELERQAERLNFDASLHRALEMADTEGEILDVLERSLPRAAPDLASELLLAEDGRGELHRAAFVAQNGEPPGCRVAVVGECPAVRQGTVMVFDSSERLDACSRLRDRPYGRCAATCVPVAVAGQAVGVLHAVRPETQPEEPDNTARLKSVATRAGARITMVRALQATRIEADTDPLTGLANRRVFEGQLARSLRQRTRATVVIFDLDHFKSLNDTHGHAVGDRSLQHFADVLREASRPQDLLVRLGGEEFLMLLPDVDVTVGRLVGDRVRTLLQQTATEDLPRFTVSAGVACTDEHTTRESLLEAADGALYAAKRAGRDIVLVSGQDARDLLLDDAGSGILG